MNSYEANMGVSAEIQYSEKLDLILGFQYCDKNRFLLV